MRTKKRDKEQRNATTRPNKQTVKICFAFPERSVKCLSPSNSVCVREKKSNSENAESSRVRHPVCFIPRIRHSFYACALFGSGRVQCAAYGSALSKGPFLIAQPSLQRTQHFTATNSKQRTYHTWQTSRGRNNFPLDRAHALCTHIISILVPGPGYCTMHGVIAPCL